MTVHYFAEKNSPSDEEIYIHDIYVKSGQLVRSGEVLMSAEGAKALFDIEMPEDGYVSLHVTVGAHIPIGEKLFSISQIDSKEQGTDPSLGSQDIKIEPKDSSESRFSKVALRLIDEHNMDLDLFKDLSFVTSESVTKILKDTIPAFSQGKLLSEFGAVALVGGGMGSEVVIECLKRMDLSNKIVGYFDASQKTELSQFKHLGAPSLEFISNGFNRKEFDALLITVTSNMKFRKEILLLVDKLQIPLATFIDERSYVSNSAVVGAGSIILDSARVGHKAMLGRNVFLSGFVNIDHHCEVGENSTFGPGVFLSGNVRTGVDCIFGSNIAVEPGITIGDNCKVASGSILTRNVPPATVVKTKSTTFFRE